jgi:hypothetical protein
MIKGEYARMKMERMKMNQSLAETELKKIDDMLEQNSNMIDNKIRYPVRRLY